MSDVVLAAQGLTKAFGNKTILREVDLSVRRGQCVAFIGHNGSGKSTLLKLLAGLFACTAGRVTRAKGVTFGYVPERFPQMALTAAQYIGHMGRIEGLRRADADNAAATLFADFFLDGLKDVPMKHLSKGTLQKIGVVQALLMPHEVLLLDEPLSGQDIASQRVFVQKALARLDAGTTVLLSCHEPFLVNRLADTVYAIENGALHAVSQADERLTETDEMVFALPVETAEPPLLPAGCAARMKADRLIVTAPVEQSQALLLNLLGKGYVLRGYHHAGDR